MRNAVPVHDLGTTELEVGCVHFATKKLVDSLSTGENDRLALNLDSTLAESDKIGTNTFLLLAIAIVVSQK